MNSYDFEDFANFDDALLRSTKEENADAYFDRVWATLTRQEKNSIARAFFGISGNKYRRFPMPELVFVQHGGEVAALAKEFADMLAAVDTYHDFNETYDVTDVVENKLPYGFDISDLDREKSFRNKLASSKTLTFREKSVVNPAFGCDLEKRFRIGSSSRTLEDVITAQHNSVSLMLGRSVRMRLEPFDVVTQYSLAQPQSKYQFLRLRQIATLIHALKVKFGRLEMVVDGDGSPLLGIAVGVKNMWKTFHARFLTDPPAETFEELSEKLRIMILQEVSSSYSNESATTRARITLTDANIFDAQVNSVSFEVDHRPTGSVLPDGFGTRIVLDGVSRDGQKKAAVEIEGIPISVSSSDASKHFSIAHIVRTATGGRPSNTPLDHFLKGVRRDTLLAIKLAGDWGQVEHCKRYDKVFVTHDKMVALYAYCRRVKFVLVSYDAKRSRDDADDANDFFRYTFLLGGASPLTPPGVSPLDPT